MLVKNSVKNKKRMAIKISKRCCIGVSCAGCGDFLGLIQPWSGMISKHKRRRGARANDYINEICCRGDSA